MRILAYHYRPVESGAHIEVTDLETLLEQSDIVHAALNENTRHLVGQRELSRMKKDAFLVNTARGSVVDENALIEALQAKKIGGAALDVFETEPLPADSPLRRLNNVILLPHTAGASDGFQFHRKRFEFFQAEHYAGIRGKTASNALNHLHTSPIQAEGAASFLIKGLGKMIGGNPLIHPRGWKVKRKGPGGRYALGHRIGGRHTAGFLCHTPLRLQPILLAHKAISIHDRYLSRIDPLKGAEGARHGRRRPSRLLLRILRGHGLSLHRGHLPWGAVHIRPFF